MDVLGIPSDPGRELPGDGRAVVSEIGEFKVVSAAGGGVDGELVLQDEGAVLDEVVEEEETFEGDGGAVGGVEAVHEEVDGGRGGGA